MVVESFRMFCDWYIWYCFCCCAASRSVADEAKTRNYTKLVQLAFNRTFQAFSPLIRLFWSLVPMTVLLYRWLTRFDGVLICGKIVNGVIGWDRWYFCNSCCWVWSFSFNWSRLCFISDVAEFDEVMMNVEDDDEELPGTSQSWWTASSGVIRFLGSHLER